MKTLDAAKFSLDAPYEDFELEINITPEAEKALVENKERILPVIYDYIDKTLGPDMYYDQAGRFQVSDSFGNTLYMFMITVNDDFSKYTITQTNLSHQIEDLKSANRIKSLIRKTKHYIISSLNKQ